MTKIYLDGIAYNQFGHDIFFTQLNLKNLLSLFEVDSHVQRELDHQRKFEIRSFILDNLEHERPFYFTSFVFSARGEIQQDAQGYYLTSGSKLYINDGQHRCEGLASALLLLKNSLESAEFVKNTEKAQLLKKRIKYLEEFPITMQIYLHLNVKQERQLFSDLNTERKDAHLGQLLQYDHRDAYSILTRQLAQRLQNYMEIELHSSRVLNSSSALTTQVIMKRCITAMFDGLYTTTVNKTTFSYPQQEVEQIAQAFFLKWLQIFPKQAHKRSHYVTGLTGIQVALALAVHHLTKTQKLSYQEAIEQLTVLKNFSWKHTEPMFQFLYSKEKNIIVGHSNSYAIRRIKDGFIKMIQQEMVVKS